GESCFETFRVIDGEIFDWPGHWSRLTLGLSEFGLLMSAGQDEKILSACLREAKKAGADSLVRLTVSGGAADWGLTARAAEPLVYIQCMPYRRSESAAFLRLESWPFPLKQKLAKFTADYSETLRALKGGDANVLFEQDGCLLATATANILIYRDGGWLTPDSKAGVLPGRVRDLLIRKKLVRAETCPIQWLTDCEAAAVCNSGLFIQPIACIANVQRLDGMDVGHAAFKPLLDLLRLEKGVRV
ncbi:MAG: aminotransferase class IV, partial [Mariprofundus sp.]